MNNPNEIMTPGISQLLEDQKADIFASFNCVNIGKIESVNKADQTVEIQLQIKRLAADATSTAYPVLVDCPYFVLQGGGGYIDMPIARGDCCIVLFNDRCIDDWWESGNVMDPPKNRKHSLSDGIAIVGINPKPDALKSDGSKLRIINNQGIEFNGNDKTFVTHAELDSALQIFMTALNEHRHTGVDTGSGTSGPPSSSMSIDISSASTTTVKTGG